MTFVLHGDWVDRLPATVAGGALAALGLTPFFSGAIVIVGLAVFVLGGSPASRVMGGLATLAGIAQSLLPYPVLGITPREVGPAAVPWGIAGALHCATFVALLVSSRTELRDRERPESTDAG